MKQEIKATSTKFEEGKRVTETTVMYTYEKSDDMKAKALLEIDAAELQRRREEVIARHKAATNENDKERLMMQLESIDQKVAETDAKIKVYQKYLEGYEDQ